MSTTASHLPDDREGAARRFNHYRCQRCGAIGLAAVTASLTTLLIVWLLGGGPW